MRAKASPRRRETQGEKGSHTEAGLGSQLNNPALWQKPYSKCENWSHAHLEPVPVAWWIMLIYETRQTWDLTVSPSDTALHANSKFSHRGKTTSYLVFSLQEDEHLVVQNWRMACTVQRRNIFSMLPYNNDVGWNTIASGAQSHQKATSWFANYSL